MTTDNMTEETNNETYLIDLVEKQFKKDYKTLLSHRLPSSVYTKFILVLGSIAGFIIIVRSLILILNILPSILKTATPDQTIIVFLTIITIFASLVIFPFATIGAVKSVSLFDVLVYYNYNELKKVNSKELYPKLLALIILKSKHPDFLLKKFYTTDKSLTDAEVLKILYDHPVTKVDF